MKAECVCFVAGFSKEMSESIVDTAHPAGIPTTVCPSLGDLFSRLRMDSNGCVVLPLELLARSIAPPVAEITARAPAVGLIFVTTAPDTRRTVTAMLLRGTHDVVEWPAEAPRLVGGVNAVLAAAAERSAEWAKHRQAGRLLDELTPGERQVLDLMAAGMPNKKVAPALGIALRTVEARRKRIFSKLGTRSLLEIANLLQMTKGENANCACDQAIAGPEPRYLKLTSA
jgi:two-component system, LuxR family, response regulator DctR